jgi:hypothetical protein
MASQMATPIIIKEIEQVPPLQGSGQSNEHALVHINDHYRALVHIHL